MDAYIVKDLLHYCNVSLKRISAIEDAAIPYYDFTFVLKGEMTYSVCGKHYTLYENDAILIKPGERRERIASGVGAKYVSYNFTVFDDSRMPKKTFLKNIVSHDIRSLVSIFSAAHISNIYSSREKSVNLLTYISERVGYENYSYFSKIFKARFGISPRKLRTEKEQR